ncbi:hypothetical protein ElyMa_003886100 [Elysia marginata]|uniref:Uncharacterized protein n=1 Tax=Elysia marginata TaxID=1093978 RepID=A0AAV4FPF1_9GAST|nr:hypothetical protein ElyMa_003886100 [Elysia marginata]
MFRCVFELGSSREVSPSDHDVLSDDIASEGATLATPKLSNSWQCRVAPRSASEIPSARLAAWRASKSGVVTVRTGRSFLEPPLGRLPPCRNLTYQRINCKPQRTGKTVYRRTNTFVPDIQGDPAPLKDVRVSP